MQENYAQDRSNHKKQLFFADLTSRTTDANVKEYFSKYGQVTNVNLVTDRYTKVSKRYGFVTFQDDQDVDNVQKARDHVIDGKTIDTRRVFSADHNKQTCYTHRCKKNFIGGIADKSLTKEILKDYFVSLGFPEPASIEFRAPQVDKTGFAFIEFDDYDICDKLVIDNPHTVNNVQYVIKKGMKKSELVGQQNMGSQMGVNPGSLANGTMGGYNPKMNHFQQQMAYQMTPYGTSPYMQQHSGFMPNQSGYVPQQVFNQPMLQQQRPLQSYGSPSTQMAYSTYQQSYPARQAQTVASTMQNQTSVNNNMTGSITPGNSMNMPRPAAANYDPYNNSYTNANVVNKAPATNAYNVQDANKPVQQPGMNTNVMSKFPTMSPGAAAAGASYYSR